MFIRQDGAPLIVNADSSYCMVDSPTARGSAVSDLVVDTAKHLVTCNSIRVDGSVVSSNSSDHNIGSCTADGWWIKAVGPDGRYLAQHTRDMCMHIDYKWLDPKLVI